jgi:hypothetical protein
MAGITLEQARKALQAWLEAELAISTGQSYKIGSRALTRADLAEVAKRIKSWERVVVQLENGGKRGPRVMRFVPRDL